MGVHVQENTGECKRIQENTGEYKRVKRKYRGNTVENEKRNRETQGI